jgi:hypothetical protein
VRPDVKERARPRHGDAAEPERTRRSCDAEIEAFKKRMTVMFVSSQPADPLIHDAAVRMARRCRWLIQASPRGEEWGEADREFSFVIREERERFVAHHAAAGKRPGA